jgi:ubiquinone/menaquinone biosynthesis C-methylase UbiE
MTTWFSDTEVATRPPVARIEPPRGVWPRIRLWLKSQLISGPRRDRRQHPDRVVAALGLQPGQLVGDVGAGSGYFAVRLARAVAPDGQVYAVDTDRDILWLVQEAADRERLAIASIVAGDHDPGLPEPVDMLFFSHAYHHLPDRPLYMTEARKHLRPDGRVAVLEYRRDRLPGRVLGHSTHPDRLRAEMAEAGYELLADHDFPAGQLFMIFGVAERAGA